MSEIPKTITVGGAEYELRSIETPPKIAASVGLDFIRYERGCELILKYIRTVPEPTQPHVLREDAK